MLYFRSILLFAAPTPASLRTSSKPLTRVCPKRVYIAAPSTLASFLDTDSYILGVAKALPSFLLGVIVTLGNRQRAPLAIFVAPPIMPPAFIPCLLCFCRLPIVCEQGLSGREVHLLHPFPGLTVRLLCVTLSGRHLVQLLSPLFPFCSAHRPFYSHLILALCFSSALSTAVSSPPHPRPGYARPVPRFTPNAAGLPRAFPTTCTHYWSACTVTPQTAFRVRFPFPTPPRALSPSLPPVFTPPFRSFWHSPLGFGLLSAGLCLAPWVGGFSASARLGAGGPLGGRSLLCVFVPLLQLWLLLAR